MVNDTKTTRDSGEFKDEIWDRARFPTTMTEVTEILIKTKENRLQKESSKFFSHLHKQKLEASTYNYTHTKKGQS